MTLIGTWPRQPHLPLACLSCLLGVEPAGGLSSAEVHVSAAALVFLNGNILGLHRRPHKFVRAMRWVADWVLLFAGFGLVRRL